MELTHDLRALVQGVPHMFLGGESKVRAGVERLASRRLGAFTRTPMSIQSAAFPHNGRIPSQYTAADGDNIQPALRFGDIPEGTRSLVLLVEDPDAPTPKPFVHFIAVLPADTRELVAGHLGAARTGRTTVMKTGWLGAAPPKRDTPHRYFFQLFALDEVPEVPERPGRSALIRAMNGHVIGYGELVGKYQRVH